MPKISVVIPTYNRAEYLGKAIESVLAQTGADFEIIISDNCSSDDTEATVHRYIVDSRVRYFRNQENVGMVRNWRKAVYERASADWFILLSDDDYLIDPDYLAKASDLIEQNARLVMVYAEGYLLDESTGAKTSLLLPFEGVVDGVEVFMSRGTVKPQDCTLCNIVFNRHKTMELNAFSNPDNLSCDSELFLKLAVTGDIGVVKGFVSVYRFHSGNLIKTIGKSVDLTYGNLDFFLSSYVFAEPRVTADQLAKFKSNAKIVRNVGNSLLVIACLSRVKYLQSLAGIAKKTPELLTEIISAPRFRIKLLLCRIGGWAYPAYVWLRR